MKKVLVIFTLILAQINLQIIPSSDQVCTFDLFDTHKYPSLSGLGCFNRSDLNTIADKISDYLILNAQVLARDVHQARQKSATIISQPLINELNQARLQLTELSKFVADKNSLLNNKRLTDQEKNRLNAAIANASQLLQ